MKTVHYCFTDYAMQNMALFNYSAAVQIRFILNAAGFKFKDDGTLEALVNTNPEPIGKFKTWYDDEERTTHYEQKYEE